VIRDHRDVASSRDVRAPFDMARAFELLEAIEVARPFRATVLGHNDLLNANFLYDGHLRVVDWEYAGMSDPFFDLANVSVNNFFPEEAEHALIRHYFGQDDSARMATLAVMKIVSELREAMWGVVQMAISKLEVDFAAYATERGNHALALADVDDLNATLAAASAYAQST
jgi:thiamine kinase-like enzyme